MGIEKFTPPPVPDANPVRPNRPNNGPVRSEMADRLAKGPEKVMWKYANPERAKMFKGFFPDLKATDVEIEEAAWWVNNFEYRKALDEAWRDALFHRLMKLRILEKRAEPKQPSRPANQPEVMWKYADPQKAAKFRQEYPRLNATDVEIEEGANKVFQDEWRSQVDSNLYEAWKNPAFWALIQREIIRVRGRL